MKKICIFIILLTALNEGNAQMHEHVNLKIPMPFKPVNNKVDYKGYTVALKPAKQSSQDMDAYSFDVLKDNKPVVRRFQNTSLFSRGIQNKEDAYKSACWIIDEFIRTGHWPNVVPPHIAAKSKVDNN